MKYSKYRKILFAFYVVIVLFICIFIQGVVHESTHWIQDDFRGSEICFIGSDNLKDYGNSAAGWYVPYTDDDGKTSLKSIIPFINDREFDAYLFSAIALFILCFILYKLFFIVDDRLKSYDQLIIEYNKYKRQGGE